ncbi:hypothetical protein [Proteiniclasticum ruminis]|uniref:hypothetical protein n=1 Tax=Proteiniclasticum ruminis TaxID=398199 RepID=UPI0028AEA410|nr:hypothetical protein [Proteiniclasticum ruminis]
MARKARIKDPYGTFHITQSGGGQKLLFEKEEDRTQFLEILKKAQLQFQFKLYAYCLLSDNQYHLVMDLNGADMSKVMKSINIGYAMYKDQKEPLFKDRYKSELLKETEDAEDVVRSLHKNGVTGSLWNSYCTYDKESPLKLDWISPIEKSADKKDTSSCRNCMETLKEAEVKLKEFSLERGLPLEDLLKDKEIRNDLILKFRKNSTLSLKELGILFGGLSESSICKILSTVCEK